jgi:hypothetical protein
MDGYDPASSFDEEVAATYDDEARGDEDDAARFLADVAGGGRAMELAIGTGRIALPLAAHGIEVHGIDLSQPMVDRLQAKPGGRDIPVTIGDMADVGVEGAYRLIYVVFNSFMNLMTQEAQIRCVENVAAHLDDGGLFVVEMLDPGHHFARWGDQYVAAEAIELDEVKLDVMRHDRTTQVLDESHVSLTNDDITLNPIVTRYVWPSELDLMARLAGLRLHDRFGGWGREAYTNRSDVHVSVYGR